MNTGLKQIVGALAIMVALAMGVNAQRASPPTQVRVIKFHGDIAELLAALADENDVTIGLEADPKKPRSEVTLDLYNVTFHDILDGIVRSEPLYQWRESDGCIEIVPANHGMSLMDTKIN